MEENEQWYEPLVSTDFFCQQQSSSQCVSWHPDIVECISPKNHNKSIETNLSTGRSMLGFSLTSPDLVVCAGSPEIPEHNVGDYSPEFLRNEPQDERETSFAISLEEGINGYEPVAPRDISESANFPSFWHSSTEADQLVDTNHFELVSAPPPIEKKASEESVLIISINAGSEDKEEGILGGMNFLEDSYFNGGDVIRTDAHIRDSECLAIYQTARFGNLSYKFPFLEPGKYLIDLHFAEIVFIDGPLGMRVFDVFLQEEKVVSRLDIFGRVGANRPLILSDIEASVNGDEGLSIRLAAVTGNPIICGISVRKVFSTSSTVFESLRDGKMTQLTDLDSMEGDTQKTEGMGDYERLGKAYELQRSELAEARNAIEELRRENQVKQKECQEAWSSLKDLQSELMRKSMHVGSLAFAIEGQVKEKTKWFSWLRDLNRRLKVLKLEHIKVSEEVAKYQKCLMEMDEMRYSIQSAMSNQADLSHKLQAKFVEGAKERKELYNKVLELKGNIRVFCRCRPLNMDEISMGVPMVLDLDSAKDGEITVRSNGWSKKIFKFDAVFGPEADQGNLNIYQQRWRDYCSEVICKPVFGFHHLILYLLYALSADVFEDIAPFASSVLDGYNVCIFAYGQTGTGKTFTMEGTQEARGINYRTLEELFRVAHEREKLFKYDISVSVLEVYNEQIRDLLVTGSQPGPAAKRLEVRQVSEGMHHVPGLVEAHVNNMSEVWDVLQSGSNGRAVGSTSANEHSSRSHCIHCVMVKGENLLNGEHTKSKLWLVDLAGSERIAKTEVQGDRLREAQNINRSLSALGDVISALATKSPHIPFRNSKLTHLLQDSLGGDSKALMFLQISPNENDVSETLCSLNFASRVKGIELGPARKQIDYSELLRYKQMADRVRQDAMSKELQIKKMEENIHNLETKVKEREHKNKNLQEKVKELESQLLIERKLARQHVDTKIAEQQKQRMTQQLEDQILAPTRPPLAARTLANTKNNTRDPDFNVMNMSRPSTFHNIQKQQSSFLPEGIALLGDLEEKENNPRIVEPPLHPKRTGRVSLCPTATLRRISTATAARRYSLIPLPTTPMMTVQLPSSLLPQSSPPQAHELRDTDGIESNCMLPPATYSPKMVKSGDKKLNSMMRRSLQKKIKSPLHQLRKGGLNVGMEKVRISIGSRGRMARRIPYGNSRRAGGKDFQKGKERGWNI